MRTFFEPRSLVVVGVSPRPGNLGRTILGNLHAYGYEGLVEAVGSRPGVVDGHRIHPSVQDLPEPVDLAVVITPAPTVPAVMEACGQRGIRRVVVESAGFSERGEEGRALERAMCDTARRYGIRFLGPNGIGTLSPSRGLVLPFGTLREPFRSGGISLVCQSGGVGISYLTRLHGEGMGVARFASVGNKLDVDECHLLEFLLEDPETELVVLYLESLSRGRRLLELARHATKPVLLHKSNTGSMAAGIAASHTAALATDDRVLDAALRQVGVLRFSTADELVDLVRVFTAGTPTGKRLAVLSRSGGHGVIVADACERAGLSLASIPATARQRIREHARAGVIRESNPVDLGDVFDFDVYVDIARDVLSAGVADALLLLHTYLPVPEGKASRRMLRQVEALGQEFGVPVLLCVATPDYEVRSVMDQGVGVFTEPERAVGALARVAGRGERVRTHLPPLPSCPSPEPPPTAPSPGEVLAWLATAGVAVPEARYVTSEEDAVRTVAPGPGHLAPRIALKVDHPALSHKTDTGGVFLDLAGTGAVREAWARVEEIFAAHVGGAPPRALAQAMAPEGVDLILGLHRDPQFGPVLALGWGGIWVELLDRISWRVAPFHPQEVHEALADLPGSARLRGARGRPPADTGAVVSCALHLTACFAAHPVLASLEINPLRVLPQGQGVLALDARLTVEDPPG